MITVEDDDIYDDASNNSSINNIDVGNDNDADAVVVVVPDDDNAYDDASDENVDATIHVGVITVGGVSSNNCNNIYNYI